MLFLSFVSTFYIMVFLSIDPQLLISMPSGGEWLTIGIVILVLFGGRKIPELARGLGKGIREFNDAKKGVQDEIEAGMKDRPKEKAANNA